MINPYYSSIIIVMIYPAYPQPFFLKRILGWRRGENLANARSVSGDDPDHYGGPTVLGALCDRAFEVGRTRGPTLGGSIKMVPLTIAGW